jgi:type IV pilus assembly protein PilA
MNVVMHRRAGQAGFTLIELLIVVAVLAILAAILIPNFVRARASSQLASCQLDLRNIAAALELYYAENQEYPDASTWENDLESGGYTRSLPVSPIDKAAYGYTTDATRSRFVLYDGPNKYTQAGISGYVAYTATGGLEVGVGSIPTP